MKWLFYLRVWMLLPRIVRTVNINYGQASAWKCQGGKTSAQKNTGNSHRRVNGNFLFRGKI